MKLVTTAQPLTGGADDITGIGMDYLFGITGTLQTGDKLTLTFTDTATGLQTWVGAGWATGVQLQHLFTFEDKIYGVAGRTLYFCALGDPTIWNDPNTAGNGFKTLSNSFSLSQDVAALAVYQGKLAAVGRQQVQIFAVDADPANNGKPQVLPNVGTVAKETVRGVGDMDLYMLGDVGFRSVRVRDASNNAIVADIGTPIDAIVQPLLATLSTVQKSASCGIVETSSNRYWGYIPKADGSTGSIYVFSYFPSSGIAAWGTYTPTYARTVVAVLASGANTVVPGRTYLYTAGDLSVSLTVAGVVITPGTSFTPAPGVTTATYVTLAGPPAISPTLTSLVQTEFIPTKFVVYNGQVYARAGDNLFQFGGSDNATYDACGASFTTPYIDEGTPGRRKHLIGVEAALEGTWQLKGAFDYDVNSYKLLYQNTKSSYLYAGIPWGVTGTHYSFKCIESGSGYARFSSILCRTQDAGN